MIFKSEDANIECGISGTRGEKLTALRDAAQPLQYGKKNDTISTGDNYEKIHFQNGFGNFNRLFCFLRFNKRPIKINAIIAIVYVASNDTDVTDFISNELEYIMVNQDFTIVDRSQLDKIRHEQNLQLSGEVDDDTAVSIGKIAGANIIITGSVTGTDSTQRLRLRALNVETAQVLAVASERL